MTRLRAIDRHLATIRTGAIDGSTVRGLRMLLNKHAKAVAWGGSWKQGDTMTDRDYVDLFDAISEFHPTIKGKLHETGLAVLRNKRYAKRLAPYADIINSEHLRFELVDFSELGRNGVYHVPVFQAITLAGSFPFRNIPWQSGGKGPEVLPFDA